jgi:Carboxypeptidase regulatory-like domain
MSVLERNLTRLLRQAYAPLRPPLELRTRVLAAMHRELASVAAPVAAPAPLLRMRFVYAAAAALLVALGAWWWWSATRGDELIERERSGAGFVAGGTTGSTRDGASETPAPRDVDLVRPEPGHDRRAIHELSPQENHTQAAIPAAPSGLSGTVVRAGDGQPVPAFELVVWEMLDLPRVGEPERHAFGSQDGAFALPRLISGRHHVLVRAPGLASHVLAGVKLPLEAPLRVELGAPSRVTGRVIDAAGAPLAGARVLCESLAPAPALPVRPELIPDEHWGGTRSGPDGSFVLTDVPLGMRRVIAFATGHAPRSSPSFELRADEPVQIADLVLGAGGGFDGRVERGDGAPWPGVLVLASSMNYDGSPFTFDLCTADELGRYRIEHLPAGPYVVMHFGDPSGAQASPEALLPGRVREGESTRLDFVDPRTKLTLTGRITQADGKPAALYPLALGLASDKGETWKGATTDADGVYVFRGLDAGEWELLGGRNMASSMTHIARFDLSGRGEIVRDFTLASGYLRGRVVAGPEARGLAKAVLLVFGEDATGAPSGFRGKCIADADGNYEIGPLSAGRYHLWTLDERGEHAAQRSEWLTLSSGQTLDLPERALSAGGSAEFTARELDGKPVAEAALSFAPLGGDEVPVALDPRTDSTGAFTARGLAPGAWTVRATDARGRSAEREFFVEADRATRVELEFGAR